MFNNTTNIVRFSVITNVANYSFASHLQTAKGTGAL